MALASSNSGRKYNWGVLGCGRISRDFAFCLRAHPRAHVGACAARDKKNALKFGAIFEIAKEKCYGGYRELIEDPDIDIVYIGTIHPTHCKNVIACLEAKKHVICEKPIGMNGEETQKMIDAAKKNGVYLLEAIWTRFFPAFIKARELVKEGVIGDVISYQGNFGFAAPPRDVFPLERLRAVGSASLLDLGIYTLHHLPVWFGNRQPRQISACGAIEQPGDIDFVSMANFIYQSPKGNSIPVQFAQIQVNLYASTSNDHVITGTKGLMKICSPGWAPNTIELTFKNGDTRAHSFELPEIDTKGMGWNYHRSNGLIYEVDAVMTHLDKGLVQAPEFTWKEMQLVADISDAILTQVRGRPYRSRL